MEDATNQPVTITLRIYRVLARAFPHEFKNLYGSELIQTGEDSAESVWRERGITGLIRLLLDIALQLPVEYWAEIRQDLRYGFRMLGRSPGFAVVALTSLSLGISIATCAISEMNGIILRNLPRVPHPDRLVAVLAPTSYPSYQNYEQQTGVFASAAAYIAPVPITVTLGGNSQRIWGQIVTPSYFSVFGVPPFLGRIFGREEEQPGRSPTLIASYRYWQQHLGSDATLVGKSITVNAHPATLIGVMPEDFLGASPMIFPADLWMPTSVSPQIVPELSDDALNRRDVAMFRVVGRLKAGITRTRAEAELNTVAQQLEQQYGEEGSARKDKRVLLAEGGKLLPLRKEDQPFFASFLLLITALVVLIACSNVANMMLARAMARRREIAVRLSLGASRARLVRQLLTENMILAFAAGTLGFLSSMWLMHLLSRLQMPFPMPVAYDLEPDGHVLLFTLAITLISGLFLGLAPAWHATAHDIAPALKQGGVIRFRSFRALSVRNLMMVSQVAGSLSLLMILGFLALGIQSSLGIQAGFNAKNLYLLSLDPIRDGVHAERVPDLLEKVLDGIKRSPSVVAACWTETVPVSLTSPAVTLAIPRGEAKPPEILTRVAKHIVGSEYFETTEIPIRAGRGFAQGDDENERSPVIVTEALVARVWRGDNPIGREIEITSDEITGPKILPGTFDYRARSSPRSHELHQVIGVAGDVAEGLIVEKPRPAIYLPLKAADFHRPSLEGLTLIIRSAPGADAITQAQKEISRLNRQVLPFNALTMQAHIDRFMSPLQMAAWTYGLIGLFGVVLAVVGLAGMTAYSTAQRRREIAVRMAFGAGARNVLALVLRETSILLITGILLGATFALLAERALGVASSTVATVNSRSSSDPWIIVGAPLLLAVLSLFACYVPGRRSTKLNPVTALRHE